MDNHLKSIIILNIIEYLLLFSISTFLVSEPLYEFTKAPPIYILVYISIIAGILLVSNNIFRIIINKILTS